MKKLSKGVKKDEKLSERIFNQLKMEERKTINMINRKYEKKIEHLYQKFLCTEQCNHLLDQNFWAN